MPVDCPRRIILCLDGTWNNTYARQRRDDGSEVVKPSNVLKLCRGIECRDPVSGREQIAYYDNGVGSLARYPGFSNRLLALTDKVLGGASGAGFEANVEDALNFLAVNHHDGDEVFLFGFSRGAATARGVTRFLDWAGGLPVKRDAFYLPELFRRFVLHKGEGSGAEEIRKIDAERAEKRRAKGRRPPEPIQIRPVRVEFLGVWDTVMALGSRFRATGDGTATASKSFYLDREPARCVRNARQALAVDEARFDFRPEIWKGCGEGQSLAQRWFPGVHSNVGGGYVDDGLANIAFQWILEEAVACGLAVDRTFTSYYKPFAKDRLYRSESMLYRALDGVRGRFGRGRRVIAQPAAANVSLDPSVLERMAADPEARKADGRPVFPDLRQRYRPENVLVFLASLPDLEAYLREVNIDLPQDARKAIERLRRLPARVPASA